MADMVGAVGDVDGGTADVDVDVAVVDGGMADVDVDVAIVAGAVVDVDVDVVVGDVTDMGVADVGVDVVDVGGIGVEVVDRLDVYVLVVGIGTVLNRSAAENSRRWMRREDGAMSWRDDGSIVTCVDGGGKV